jgi:hypothetical protein
LVGIRVGVRCLGDVDIEDEIGIGKGESHFVEEFRGAGEYLGPEIGEEGVVAQVALGYAYQVAGLDEGAEFKGGEGVEKRPKDQDGLEFWRGQRGRMGEGVGECMVQVVTDKRGGFEEDVHVVGGRAFHGVGVPGDPGRVFGGGPVQFGRCGAAEGRDSGVDGRMEGGKAVVWWEFRGGFSGFRVGIGVGVVRGLGFGGPEGRDGGNGWFPVIFFLGFFRV